MAPDLTVLTAVLDLTNIVIVIINVVGAIASVYVAVVGARMVLAAIRGDDCYEERYELNDAECQQWFASESKENLDANGITCWQDFKKY